MATTSYALTGEWSATNRKTFSATTSCVLCNRTSSDMFIEVTTSDTTPTLAVADATCLKAWERLELIGENGDRLWMASRVSGKAALLEG